MTHRLNQTEMEAVWKALADLINTQPLEERVQYYRGIRTLVHSLVDTMGKIYSAESLLRYKTRDNPELVELLDVVRTASQRSIELVKDFALNFDDPTPQDKAISGETEES